MGSCPSNLLCTEQSFRRIEVLAGTPRRRQWLVEEKAAVVAASLAPGAVARQVALRYWVHPNHLRLAAGVGVGRWRRRRTSRGVCPGRTGAIVGWWAIGDWTGR
jgi:hypothetical protein